MISEPPSKSRRRRWGLGVLTLVVGVLSLTIYTHLTRGDLGDAYLRRGTDQLFVAIESGEPTHFERARHQFTQAVGTDLFSAYPAFLIQVADDLEAIATQQAASQVPAYRQRYLLALSNQQWSQALVVIEEMIASGAGDRSQRDHMKQLARELQRRAGWAQSEQGI